MVLVLLVTVSLVSASVYATGITAAEFGGNTGSRFEASGNSDDVTVELFGDPDSMGTGNGVDEPDEPEVDKSSSDSGGFGGFDAEAYLFYLMSLLHLLAS